MQQVRYVRVGNDEYSVLISDEREALLAADAAGRAIIGLWDPNAPDRECGPADFLVEHADDVDEPFLECVVRRRLGLPWTICETERLAVREICQGDIRQIVQGKAGNGFGSREAVEAYIRHQYPVFGFGIWAVTNRQNGSLVGLAGVTAPQENRAEDEERYQKRLCRGCAEVILEMGYFTFPEYRQRGYAKEACLAVMEYASRELEAGCLLLRIARGNLPSQKMAAVLGFERIEGKKERD